MNSNIQTSTNNEKKERIKPENYTLEMYDYFQENFTANLAYIKDDGKYLDIGTFFDLCIGNIHDAPWYIPEIEDWFQIRKQKIESKKTYRSKRKEFKNFIETYKNFFKKGQTNLSGAIRNTIDTILSNNPTN